MRGYGMSWLLLAALCASCLPGCGGRKEDTSHRKQPEFVDAAKDPTAIMPGYRPPGVKVEEAKKK
jgi:hypothetical protein